MNYRNLLFSALLVGMASTSMAMEPSDPNHDTVIIACSNKTNLRIAEFSRHPFNDLTALKELRRANQLIRISFTSSTMNNLESIMLGKQVNMTKDEARLAYASAYALGAPYKVITTAADLYCNYLWQMTPEQINEDVKKLFFFADARHNHCARKFIYDGINNGLKARGYQPYTFEEQNVNIVFERVCPQRDYVYRTDDLPIAAQQSPQRPTSTTPSSSSEPRSPSRSDEYTFIPAESHKRIVNFTTSPDYQLRFIRNAKEDHPDQAITIPYPQAIYDLLIKAVTQKYDAFQRVDRATVGATFSAAFDLGAPREVQERLARMYLEKMPKGQSIETSERLQNERIKQEIRSRFNETKEIQQANSQAAQGFVRNQRSLMRKPAKKLQPAPAQQPKAAPTDQPQPSLWQRVKNFFTRSR